MHNKFTQNDIVQSYYIFIANIASCKRKKYGITILGEKSMGEKRNRDFSGSHSHSDNQC